MTGDRGVELLVAAGFVSLEPAPNSSAGTPPLEREIFVALDQRSNPCLVAVERAAPVGTHALEGAVARGWLRLRGHVAGAGRAKVVVVIARSLGPRSREQLDTFVESTIGPDLGWIVTDGRREFARSKNLARSSKLEASGAAVAEPAPRRARRRAVENVCTDGMLCCAKALLRREFPRAFDLDLVPKSSGSPLDRLAAEANVSRMQSRRFLNSFEAHGFARRIRDRIDLVRRGEYFARVAERMIPAYRNAVRAAPRAGAIADWQEHPKRLPGWRRWSDQGRSGARVALGAHEAAKLHGVDEVTGAPVSVHVDGDLEEAAAALDLELDPKGDAGILLVRTPFPEAVFRFTLHPLRTEGWSYVDVLQAWIDARLHPTRGGELAAAIARDFPALFADPEGSS